MKHDSSYDTAIAIVGMAGRFPGARNVEQFWQNIAHGVKSIRSFSDEELLAAGVDPELLTLPNYVKAGSKIDDVDRFDASFFGFTPREAEVMDPQHRLFLECAWEALEDAAYDMETYEGLVGVFAGSALSLYLMDNIYPNTELMELIGRVQASIGNDRDSLASMVSYKLNLRGPSFAVQTFCSTSLVATHLACQSLLNYECDMALSGGVAVFIPQENGYLYEEGGIVSPDGECRTFDVHGQGSVMGNGIGTVVLKRYHEAVEDGDHIYAIIRGSAINNDGSVRVSYTAPGLDGQAGVIAAALGSAGIEPDEISYLEAHGTATKLGDAVELAAMKKAFGKAQGKQFCAIGSVKPNVGHLDRAAGVTGLIKTVMALTHKQLPPHLNFQQANPDVDLEHSPFYVNTSLKEWPAQATPRRAGVSSFGVGGTNAHVVVEEGPEELPSSASRPWQLLFLSGKTDEALQRASSNLLAHLKTHDELSIADVAYTLQVGRSIFPYRQAIVCKDREDAIRMLEAGDAAKIGRLHESFRNRPVAFLFPGVGEQYVGLAEELYRDEPIFRETLKQCFSFLESQLGLDLRPVLYAEHAKNGHAGLNGHAAPTLDLRAMLGRNGANGSSPSPSGTQLQQTAYAQPAVFVIEYALAQLLLSWGIQPQAMLGYSVGEYVAACVAGVLSLEDALTLVTRRAQLIQALPAGAMLAVALHEAEARAYCNEEINLAAINAPATCVLAGPVEAVVRLEARLLVDGIAYRRVETTHAFHTDMMKPLYASVSALASAVSLHAPKIPYISNVTGNWITAEEATDPTYWARHMCQTARFADGVSVLLQEREQALLEVGAGQSLGSFVRQHPDCGRERMSLVYATLPARGEQRPALAALLSTLSHLWLAGVTIDWRGFYRDEQRRRVALPTYPFQRQRHWIDAPAKNAQQTATSPQAARAASGKKADSADWFYLPTWKQAPLPAATGLPDGEAAAPYLLFADTTGLSDQLAEQLRAAHYRVVSVYSGEHFAAIEGGYTLNPTREEDYGALSQALQSAGLLPGTLLHCWGVTPATGNPVDAPSFDASQQSGFYSLLFLARALSAVLDEEALQIVVVTSNLQAVTGQEAVQPEKATVSGLCKVLPQELSNISCRSVDLALNADEAQVEQSLLAALLQELTETSRDRVVAYRDGVRHVETYEATHFEQAAQAENGLRQRGVYLITGGLGGVGPVLARDLATRVQARLVLVGRSAFPERHAWSSWLAQHGADDLVSRKIQMFQAIEEAGGELLILQADVADEAQMTQVIEQIYQRFGQLNGVIHAAGVTHERAFKIIQDVSRSECQVHFQPKVYGTLVLERILRGRDLDFCLLFSSVSAVLGGLGFAAYAAGNSFLDAFARQCNAGVSRDRSAATFPWISVNWDTWRVTTAQMQSTAFGATVADYEMNDAEGAEALARILAADGVTHIVQSTGDLQARIRQWVLFEPAATAKPVAKAASSSPALPSGDYERRLAEIWQQVLGIEQVGLNDNFFDLGGNSLIGLQAVTKIRKAFHVQIPVVALFEAPTISTMAKYLQPEPEASEVAHEDEFEQRRKLARQAIGQQDIAIVAMTGRFPGAATIEQFWQNLHAGIESITVFSDEELLATGVDKEALRDPNYVKARPVLTKEQVEHFDAAFFGYSPREAQLMDPQHRLFLECCWEALELAGYNPYTYKGLIGTYGGANISSYMHTMLTNPTLLASLREVNEYQVVVGMDRDSLTTGVSYKLDLKGPSFAVQTFCSTSLVAVHLACQNLRTGECDMALAGGVSVRVPYINGHLYAPGGMESPDGHCRTFDAQAHGTMVGDGVGVVVLKRLTDALADRDTIYAVIKGSAINNDGSLKVSYSAPSVSGQADVVLAALASANVDPASISYIEAHGTATELGDPIEVASLTRAFRTRTEQQGYCAIGSVKTNIGHLDRAAGVSGLIKTVLALKHEALPASLHYTEPNPQIDFEHSPFYVNASLAPWKRNGVPRRAGINSLGMGGTNVHVIVEEAPVQEPTGPARSWQLLTLSARTESALQTATNNLIAHLKAYPDQALADVAYTLQVGRSLMQHRRFVLGRNREEMIAALEAGDGKNMAMSQSMVSKRPVAFLFPGLGEQYVGLAQTLYEQEPEFRAIVERCCTMLQQHQVPDLRSILFEQQAQSDTCARKDEARAGLDLRALLKRDAGASIPQQLKQTSIAQPAVFVIEYALACLLQQWGIQPQALLGYSLGEYVAACLSGVLSLEDALLLVARRAQLIEAQESGAMLAVFLSEEEVRPYLSELVSLAVINAPNTCVLSGTDAAIARLEARFKQDDVICRRVETTHAFHSSMLEPVSEALTSLVRSVTLNVPRIPYISNVTGTWITPEQATDPSYWAAHMCRTVRFADGVGELLQNPDWLLLEVGAGQSLGSFVRQHPACSRERMATVIPTLPSFIERHAEQSFLLTALGKLWLAGVAIDWNGFYRQERRGRVPLPTYPFERQRYWLEAQSPNKQTEQSTFIESSEKLARLADLSDWFFVPGWKQAPPVELTELRNAQQSSWLLLSDDKIGPLLRERLIHSGQYVISVSPGATFRKLDEKTYCVRPAQKDDYEALLQDLQAQGRLPAHVVHLWSVAPDTADDAGEEHLQEILRNGIYSVLALIQAIGEVDSEACTINVVSQGVYDVLGTEQLTPEKALLVGPCRVLAQEYAHLSGRFIDITVPATRPQIEELLAELRTPVEENVVALRGTRRWVQTFETVKLDGTAAPTRLREGGVYLITGGLGGIGLAIAEYLALTTDARLVLVGRTALPPRHEWAQTLLHAGTEKGVGRQIECLQRIEALGAKVLVVQGDVSNEEQMQAIVAQTLETFGALHGVVHTAGVPAVGLMQLKTPAMVEQVLASKVRGTRVLERVLQDCALDFLVLFSSITSLTGGGPGQMDYCAANAYLDAYARRNSNKHGTTVAINWSEWQWNAWGAGLAGHTEEAQTFFKAFRAEFGIGFEDGTEALRRILSSTFSQVIVSTQDFREVTKLSKSFTAAEMLQRTRRVRQEQPMHPRPSLVNAYSAPRSDLERQIVAIWEELLGLTPVGIEDNFFELGGNSLLGIDLIVRLKKTLKASTLTSHVIYEAPTVLALAEYIMKGKSQVAREEWQDRSEKRRAGLKQRVRETGRARL